MGNSFTSTAQDALDAGGGAESISPTTTSSTDESLERRLKQLDAEKASGAVQTMIQQDDEETDKKNEDAQKRPCDGTRHAAMARCRRRSQLTSGRPCR